MASYEEQQQLEESPFTDRQLKRLRRAMDWSWKKLQPFRETQKDLIRQYVGKHYSDSGTDERVPINLVEMAVNIYTVQLAAKAPRALCTTRFDAYKAYASTLSLAVNHLIDEIRLEETLRQAVRNAMFSLGIVKVGLNPSGSVEVGGFLHDVCQPYADVVNLDDWVQDMTAKRYEQIEYAGNRYRVPVDWVKNSDLYFPDARAQLMPTEKLSHDNLGDERLDTISRGASSDVDEFKDYVELWDLWLPSENLVVTIPVEQESLVLRVVEWAGPEAGPYHLLSFNAVPGNPMPLSPGAQWLDLHMLANVLFLKLGRQAKRQKEILGYQGGAADDAKRIGEASDGQMIRMDSPSGAKVHEFGGVNAQTLAMFLQTKDLATWLWGNLDLLGGLSPQSGTLGQDELLAGQASKRVADMQDRTVDFSTEIIRALAWYLWTDPLIEIPLVKRVEGIDEDIPTAFTAEDREGDFLDYNINIEPYSMQHYTPSQRLQTIMQIWERFLVPYTPMLQQQGISLDIQALLKLIGKYSSIPELKDILITSMPLGEEEPGPVGNPPNKPSLTKHVNERVNRPGATRSGKDATLMQTLMGGNAQPAELAALGRPVG